MRDAGHVIRKKIPKKVLTNRSSYYIVTFMRMNELLAVAIESLRLDFPTAYRAVKMFCIPVAAPGQPVIRTREGFAIPIVYPSKSRLRAGRL